MSVHCGGGRGGGGGGGRLHTQSQKATVQFICYTALLRVTLEVSS